MNGIRRGSHGKGDRRKRAEAMGKQQLALDDERKPIRAIGRIR